MKILLKNEHNLWDSQFPPKPISIINKNIL